METLWFHNPARPPQFVYPSHGLFTAAVLAAAELLVQLSGSSEAEEDRSSSPSLRSVKALSPTETVMLLENEDEETGPGRRRTKRYRSIAQVYAAMTTAGGRDRGEEPRWKEKARGEGWVPGRGFSPA